MYIVTKKRGIRVGLFVMRHDVMRHLLPLPFPMRLQEAMLPKLVRETRMSHDEAQLSVAEHMGNSLAVQGV